MSNVNSAAPYWHLHNVLPLRTVQLLLDFVCQAQSAFTPTTTMTGAEKYRSSWVLYEFEPWRDRFLSLIQTQLPTVQAALDIYIDELTQIEMQFTAHNDGHYYKIHNDNGNEIVADRILSYVYYFHQEPKPYRGGDLRLYDLVIQDGYYKAADHSIDIPTVNNSLIVFPSHLMHEVLPIECRSRQWCDSRFTVNGWVRSRSRFN